MRIPDSPDPRILPLVLIALSSLLASCSPLSGDSPGVPARQALTTKVDLISPTTCATRNGRLLSCQISPRTLTFDDVETAVPLRTTLTVERAGNCSTQFPLSVDLTVPGEAPIKFTFNSETRSVVRRSGGAAIASLQLADGSPWTPVAAFDSSCRMGLNLTPNQVDADTKQQAQAFVAALQADRDAKLKAQDRARELMLYSDAFVFMKGLADNFRVQLTSEQMQALRSSALEADPVLQRMIMDCGVLTDDERTSLLGLYTALPALGDPAAWRNPDGTAKTLADFLGVKAAAVLQTVTALGAQGSGAQAAQYRVEYDLAAAAAAKADAQLMLARQQLASLLGS